MRIVVVEDEQDLANAIAKGLRKQGYAVDTALDGEAGWEAAEINDYDLLILDLNLPELDGLEVCRRLRATRSGLLILMLTARIHPNQRIEGLATRSSLAASVSIWSSCRSLRKRW